MTFAPDTEGMSRSGTGSRTKTTVRSGTSGVGGFGSLGPLMEEEEESTMGSATGGVTQSQRGTKRRAEEDEDVEMGDDADAPPLTKRKTGDEGTSMQDSNEPQKKAQKPVSQPGYKEGYLTKRGKNFGGWKTRYFVLQGPSLEYCESVSVSHCPLASLPLRHTCAEFPPPVIVSALTGASL